MSIVIQQPLLEVKKSVGKTEKFPRLKGREVDLKKEQHDHRGVKKNAKGYLHAWNGFKLHVDVNDLGLALSTVR